MDSGIAAELGGPFCSNVFKRRRIFEELVSLEPGSSH